ncbi:MAG: pyridoxal phosphate-dependent aminotransferase [Clostridia bacterium]|nr:pyridoxal phosphate-dependent aminotransferase [Clostridia bacterium]
MVAEKMAELGRHSSKIRQIAEYGRARKLEIGEENVFDFSLGNPSIPAPDAVKEALISLIADTPAEILHGYTSSAGDHGVRKSIAGYIEKTYGAKADASLIYMTCGAAASLCIAFGALIEEGDEVIVPSPYFPEYKVFIEKAGGKFVAVPCKSGTFRLDAEAIKNAVNPKTKLVLVNTPNNPTGAVYPEEDIKALAAVLKAKEKEFGKEIYLLSDEPYRELFYGEGILPFIPNYYDDSIVAYSYSQSLSRPGERIGYLFVSPNCRNSDDVFNAVCGAGRSLGYVCAPALFQRLIPSVLGVTSDLAEYRENRKILLESLTRMGYELTPPDGAFYLFVKSPEPDADAFCEKAKKHEILLVPSDDFGVKGYARLAYCTSKTTVLKSLAAFEALMKEYR